MLEEYFYTMFFINSMTIAVCFFLKIPQIWTLFQTKNAQGVSVNGAILELVGCVVHLSYYIVQEYPFSTYFEYAFLVFQNVVLVLYIYYLMGTLNFIKISGMGLSGGIVYGLTLGFPHPSVLDVLIKSVPFILAASKVLHLRAIWTTKNSNNISILTWFVAVLGGAASTIATVLASGDEASLFTNQTASLALNVAIIASALYFKKKEEVSTETRKKV